MSHFFLLLALLYKQANAQVSCNSTQLKKISLIDTLPIKYYSCQYYPQQAVVNGCSVPIFVSTWTTSEFFVRVKSQDQQEANPDPSARHAQGNRSCYQEVSSDIIEEDVWVKKNHVGNLSPRTTVNVGKEQYGVQQTLSYVTFTGLLKRSGKPYPYQCVSFFSNGYLTDDDPKPTGTRIGLHEASGVICATNLNRTQFNNALQALRVDGHPLLHDTTSVPFDFNSSQQPKTQSPDVLAQQ